MPKKRKPMSAEQRQAASERMKKYHEDKKAEQKMNAVLEAEASGDIHPEPEQPQEPEQPREQPYEPSQPVNQATVTLTQEQFQMMLDRLSARPEPQASPAALQQAFPTGQPPTLNAQGGVVGVIERFPIDPKKYDNPLDQLYDTPELRRFNLRDNYVLDWKVTPTKYQTAMGTWYIEPRFELTLKKKQWDEDGNELVKYDDKGKAFHPRIVIGRASFFEDPPANILEAEEAGVSLDDLDKPEFQDKMRMYRYRFWLLERIMPKRQTWTTSRVNEEVIGGKVYEIDEFSNPI